MPLVTQHRMLWS